MYISFAWTTPALLARAKSATRRMWAPSHAAKFRAGQIVDAYDRSPRLGGRRVATIRIARDPWKQRTGLMDDVVDYEREGIRHMAMLSDLAPDGSRWHDWWHSWKRADELVYVVEFQVIEVLS